MGEGQPLRSRRAAAWTRCDLKKSGFAYALNMANYGTKVCGTLSRSGRGAAGESWLVPRDCRKGSFGRKVEHQAETQSSPFAVLASLDLEASIDSRLKERSVPIERTSLNKVKSRSAAGNDDRSRSAAGTPSRDTARSLGADLSIAGCALRNVEQDCLSFSRFLPREMTLFSTRYDRKIDQSVAAELRMIAASLRESRIIFAGRESSANQAGIVVHQR